MNSKQKTVLITGAAGNLGRKLWHHLKGQYLLKLLDRELCDEDNITRADLAQWDNAWVNQFKGVDTVVHLAADPNPARRWDELVEPNIDALINVFTAAIQNNVKRIVYASSNHVMGGYLQQPEPDKITTELPVMPGAVMEHLQSRTSTPYAGAKLMGERLGKCYADIYGVSVIAVRIGLVQRDDNRSETIKAQRTGWWRDMWLSDRDYCQLMQRCIEADPAIQFAIVNGMSDNEEMRWDIKHTRELVGYEPRDGLD